MSALRAHFSRALRNADWMGLFLSLNRWRKPSGGALQELVVEATERQPLAD